MPKHNDTFIRGGFRNIKYSCAEHQRVGLAKPPWLVAVPVEKEELGLLR